MVSDNFNQPSTKHSKSITTEYNMSSEKNQSDLLNDTKINGVDVSSAPIDKIEDLLTMPEIKITLDPSNSPITTNLGKSESKVTQKNSIKKNITSPSNDEHSNRIINSQTNGKKRYAKNVKSYTNLKIITYLSERHKYDYNVPYLKSQILPKVKHDSKSSSSLSDSSTDLDILSKYLNSSEQNQLNNYPDKLRIKRTNTTYQDFFADNKNPVSGRRGASLGDIFGDLINQETYFRGFNQTIDNRYMSDDNLGEYSIVPEVDIPEVNKRRVWSKRPSNSIKRSHRPSFNSKITTSLESNKSDSKLSSESTQGEIQPDREHSISNQKPKYIDDRRATTFRWILDDYVDRDNSLGFENTKYGNRIIISLKIIKRENMILMSQLAYLCNDLNCIENASPTCIICKFPIFNLTEMPFCGCTYNISGSIFINSAAIDNHSEMFGYAFSKKSESIDSEFLGVSLEKYIISSAPNSTKKNSEDSIIVKVQSDIKDDDIEEKDNQVSLFGNVFSNLFKVQQNIEEMPLDKGIFTDYGFPEIIFLADPETFIKVQIAAENSKLRKESIISFKSHSSYINFLDEQASKKSLIDDHRKFRELDNTLDIQKICNDFDFDKFKTFTDTRARQKIYRRKSTINADYLSLTAVDSDDSLNISSYNNTFDLNESDENCDDSDDHDVKSSLITDNKNYKLNEDDLSIILEEFELLNSETKIIKKYEKLEKQNAYLKKMLLDLYFT
ncbi:hypothetical protein BB561_002867 [Smittium simulii]|uniref:Uncharacterized protein n=1 Tax=Smittium simulii TaxID=133385 RepID=A0A2T9YNX2_9FUNG|nr:hypothetical protein BB561_002867 [Smittium simulii]